MFDGNTLKLKAGSSIQITKKKTKIFPTGSRCGAHIGFARLCFACSIGRTSKTACPKNQAPEIKSVQVCNRYVNYNQLHHPNNGTH